MVGDYEKDAFNDTIPGWHIGAGLSRLSITAAKLG